MSSHRAAACNQKLQFETRWFRRVVYGILSQLRTDSSWRDVPERYSPRTALYNCFSRQRKAGVLDQLLDAVSKRYAGDIALIDGSSVCVHQHGASAKKGGSADPSIGHPRGGNNWANIPAKANGKQTFSLGSKVYRQRSHVALFFNRIKRMHGIATRYDR